MDTGDGVGIIFRSTSRFIPNLEIARARSHGNGCARNRTIFWEWLGRWS